ncbi:endonuclease-reverse transcriptase [Plakobranchus ocellatus]|uniref:Endonuclease-reverse transcriptase n=1 Tax=Plakobranchus ocellatus TaxID=259542 RepID=A0AAV4AIE6_9GAST|nr:endonuclease-reverse transcriptase [Plakobranchus ocellatus]
MSTEAYRLGTNTPNLSQVRWRRQSKRSLSDGGDRASGHCQMAETEQAVTVRWQRQSKRSLSDGEDRASGHCQMAETEQAVTKTDGHNREVTLSKSKLRVLRNHKGHCYF